MTKNSNEDNIRTLVEELRVDLSGYFKKRARLFKLDAFEKSGIALSKLGYSLIVLIISSAILFFFLFGLAFFLGELLNSNAAGFAILLGFSVIVLIIVMLNAKRIKRAILMNSIEMMRKIDNNEEE